MRMGRERGFLGSVQFIVMRFTAKNLAGHVGGSLLVVTLVITRSLATGQWLFLYLPWNLFLAWVPLGLAWLTWRTGTGATGLHWLSWLFGFGWLLFFPNSPYILTDLQHLIIAQGYDISTLWFDLPLNLLAALTGLMLGLHSLAIMHELVRRRAGLLGGWVFALLSMFLAGVGVYLGRYQRWNSWDLFGSPVMVVGELAERIVNPLGQVRSYAFSLLFASVLLVTYLTARALSAPAICPRANARSEPDQRPGG